jgi:CheY-like chemotaxis protein
MATVLIADDEAEIRSLLRTTLEGGEVEVIEVEDGHSAVAAATAAPPDLVILDWSMPGQSGIEVCRALRAEPSTANVRILLLTARSDPDDERAALAAGADDFITKPFSPLALLDKVAEILGPDALLPGPRPAQAGQGDYI